VSRLRVGLGQEKITATAQIWRDPARPSAERVADLLGRMTLTERLAQLGSVGCGHEPTPGSHEQRIARCRPKARQRPAHGGRT